MQEQDLKKLLLERKTRGNTFEKAIFNKNFSIKVLRSYNFDNFDLRPAGRFDEVKKKKVCSGFLEANPCLFTVQSPVSPQLVLLLYCCRHP